MRIGATVAVMVATILMPIASTAQEHSAPLPPLQTSVSTMVGSHLGAHEIELQQSVQPSAGAGDSSSSTSTTNTNSANATKEQTSSSSTQGENVSNVPTEYYNLASDLTQSLCDAVRNGLEAAIDYLRGKAYHSPVKPEDFLVAVSLSALKAVIDHKLSDPSFQKPLNELHLELVRVIGPNVATIEILTTVTAEMQEKLKEMIDEIVRPIKNLLNEAYQRATTEDEKNAYESAESELDNAVKSLAKYLSDIFCMILSKVFSFSL